MLKSNLAAAVVLLVMLGACSSSDEPSQNQPESSDSGENGGTSAGRIDSATMCTGLVTDREPVTISSMAKPAPMVPYNDPALGAKVIRITDAQSGEVIKPVYNTIQAFNADESLLMLYHTGTAASGGHHLYDGKTYQLLRVVDIRPRDLEQVYWDTTNPNLFYYVASSGDYANNYVQYDVSTNTKTALHDFTGLCTGNAIPTAGNDPQMTSWDSDVIGLRCPAAPFNTFTYRKSTDTVSPMVGLSSNPQYSDYVSANATPGGQRAFLRGDVLNANSMTIQRTLDMVDSGAFKGEHSVLGKTSGGADAYFSVLFDSNPNSCSGDANRGIGTLTMWNIETGACRVLVGQSNGYNYPLSGIHPSALSYQQPQWVAASIIAYNDFDSFGSGQLAPLLASEIILANTDPDDPAVCRLAHTRTTGKSATNGGYAGYFGEPHPVISPKGTRIVFGSDWYDSGSVDTFIIELPPYQP